MNISNIQKLVEEGGVIFLSYGGFLSQELISAMTEALEKETEVSNIKIGISNNIFTIFIELSQNMMNYSKLLASKNIRLTSDGLIFVSKDQDKNYYIHSQNIVTATDMRKLEENIKIIQALNKDEIKVKYKELRRSGQNTHAKGGGIGLYEIAKRCDKMDYEFKKIDDENYYFHISTKIILNKQGRK